LGGLFGSTGLLLWACACGVKAGREALKLLPQNIAVAGLGVALLAGIAAGLFGDPLFTGQWLFINPTEDSKGLPLSTVLVFDIGVYLVVFGSILSIVFAMEEEI